MKKTLLLSALAALLFIQCGQEKDPYLIKKGEVGHLTTTVTMKQVDSIFAQDSLVWLNPVQDALGTQGEVEIYEKGGKKLLMLSPHSETDPDSNIGNVQVFDERFITETGLNINSTFGDLKANYEIESVETTLNAVVIFIKDSDIFITIDKRELPENVRYTLDKKVELTQIPDSAKFKYFMIGWDEEVEKEETETETEE
ncbi:hypothetical protein POV27_15700 [Aureisphaera galaxeae]|uniref:hypothetical protein n=1 Tax=Aureisphaera galaxeae TaxID=1538023 RepID=UPI00234FE353|nr:hypothetical protein [Aureisphaera galaxeae]MDC8005502.1 hypothetical protein [Aureisphaera galaxeae]